MLAFSQGSAEAFTELFRRYKADLWILPSVVLPIPLRPRSLPRKLFWHWYAPPAATHPGALFRTYLYAIGLKLVRAHCRKATFRALFLGTSSSDPVKHDGVESALWVRRAVAKLAPLDREILMLRECEQLSCGEIADLLAIPLNTVRSRLFRARMALRDFLEPAASSVKSGPPTVQGVLQIAIEKGSHA